MTQNLRTDPSEISKFILNAALNKDPVFNSYKNLCKIQNNQKIDYVDFEWKYYQFYHGNRDLAIEKSPENSSTLTFSDLPLDVLEKIVEGSSLRDCLALRKVCHDLRNLVDSTGIHCEYIGFYFDYDFSRIELDDLIIGYDRIEDGLCTVSWAYSFCHCKTIQAHGSFQRVMLADASTILKNPKLKIGRLLICVEKNSSCIEFLKILRSLNFELNARSIYIFASAESVLSILQLMKPGDLERISLNPHEMTLDQFNELSETEQWKKATSFCWRGFPKSLQVEFSDWIQTGKLLHFKDIRINDVQFYEENVIIIRDIFLKSAHLEFCLLGTEQFDWPMGDCVDFFAVEEEDNGYYEHREENEYEYEDDEENDNEELVDDYYDDEYLEDDEVRIERILSEDPAYNVETRRFSIPNSREYFQLKLKRGQYQVVSLKIKKCSFD